jgi:hypothetical protein
MNFAFAIALAGGVAFNLAVAVWNFHRKNIEYGCVSLGVTVLLLLLFALEIAR